MHFRTSSPSRVSRRHDIATPNQVGKFSRSSNLTALGFLVVPIVPRTKKRFYTFKEENVVNWHRGKSSKNTTRKSRSITSSNFSRFCCLPLQGLFLYSSASKELDSAKIKWAAGDRGCEILNIEIMRMKRTKEIKNNEDKSAENGT